MYLHAISALFKCLVNPCGVCNWSNAISQADLMISLWWDLQYSKWIISCEQGPDCKNSFQALPEDITANGDNKPLPSANMIRSHSASGGLHGVQPDPVAADFLRKEREQETFVRMKISPGGMTINVLIIFTHSTWLWSDPHISEQIHIWIWITSGCGFKNRYLVAHSYATKNFQGQRSGSH